MSLHVQVAVIGGGLGGPVMALCLKRHGIACAVFESRAASNIEGGNIGLAPNALRVLDHVGIWEYIRNSGFVYEGLGFESSSGATLGSFLNGSEKLYNYPAIRIHRSDVRRFLLQKLADEGIPVYHEKRLTSIVEETATSITVAFSDGDQISSDFVIGCDGVRSRVRQYIHPTVAPDYNGTMGIQGTIFKEQLLDQNWPQSLPRMVLGPEGVFGIAPADPEGTEVGFITTFMAPKTSEEYRIATKTDKKELLELLRKRFCSTGSSWPEPVRVLVNRVQPETIMSFPFNVMPDTEQWYSTHGRAIFIGDAAHAMAPTGGQGAAMAFEDAETLSCVLARHFHAPPPTSLAARRSSLNLNHALAAWCSHRQERVKKVREFAERNGKIMNGGQGALHQMKTEWYIWAGMRYMGPTLGAQWLYQYHSENVNGVLSG